MYAWLESLRLHIHSAQSFSQVHWPATDYIRPYAWLYWVQRGAPCVSFGTDRHSLTRGALFLAPANLRADYACEGVVCVDSVAFSAPLSGGIDFSELPFSEYALRVTAKRETDSAMKALMAAASDASPSAILIADSILRRLLARFLDYLDMKTLERRQDRTSRFTPVLEYIDAHLADSISLDTLAGIMHLSSTHFAEAFAAALGISPRRYINRRRMEAAQHLLETTEAPVKTVAAQVGYTDPFYFARLFTRMVGAAPTAYRTVHAHRLPRPS